MVVNRLSREDGLPDQDIDGIFFDSEGFAWISTFGGGLARYDGDSFLSFSPTTDPEFPGNIVRNCREDRFGRLWVPTSGGMDIMDLKTLTHLGDFPGMSKAWRQSHFPVSLRIDSKGCIWFTSHDNLFRVSFSEDGNTFIVDSLRCNVLNEDLMPKPGDVENDGSAWITLRGRFYKVRHIDGKGLSLSEILPGIDIGEDNRATSYLRTGGDVWIGTTDGLYRVDISTGQHVCYRHSESDIHSLANDEITGLCLSSDGEIVVGTLGGVSIYNPARRTFDTYGSRANEYGNQILPGEIVRGIAARGRQIWVGLEAGGVVILQKKNLSITNLSQIEAESSIIPSAPVRAVFNDSKGNMWLAVTGFGICKQTGELTFRNYNTDNSSLKSNSITAFCEDGHGRLWMGTVDGYLHYTNISGNDAIHSPSVSRPEVERNIDVVFGMAYDSINDYIWIAARMGLFIYDIGNSTFIESPVKISSCLGVSVESGRLWVSRIGGVTVIDLETLKPRDIDGLPVCMSVVPDGDTVWCGTLGNGLYRIGNWTSDKPDITVFSESDGLADNQVHGLLLDGIYLWITTENGLSRIDTQTDEINSYGLGDGLKSMAFCENSIAKGSNGTVYLGLKGGGFSILRTRYIASGSGSNPDVVISGYYTNGVFHNASRSEIINKDEKDTDFTLKFSDLSYETGAGITYESRAYPMSKEWTPVYGNDKHVRFGHIPGGKYHIQIRAVDKDGKVLSQDERIMDVKPVLYNRWWFRILVLAVLALIAQLSWIMYSKSVKRSEEILKQEVERQTRILNDQKEELERKARKLSEQNALLQKQNEMIASHNTLYSSILSSKESDFNSQLLDAIQKKYKDPELDVYALADAMGMSRSILNERIQMSLGQSIAQFIRTYRLNVAKEMIGNGTNKDMNISEIAYEVGFNDPKYFTRCFTREFGITPSELQRKGKDTHDRPENNAES